MKVCMLTSVHPWNDTRIYGKMTQGLVRLGHQVHLVVPMAVPPQPVYQDGVTLHPVPKPTRRWKRMFKTVREVVCTAADIPADVYHFHDPELLLWAGWLQKKTRRPVIYDVHEDVRLQIHDKEWLPRWSRRLVSRLTGWVEDSRARGLDAIVAATPAIARRFTTHPRRIIVQNFPWLDELAPSSLEAIPRQQGLFVYVGGISAVRGIREMIVALERVGPKARLALAGDWESTALRAACTALPGWSQVEEYGFVNREEVRHLLQEAQAGLVLFHPKGNHVESQPNKLFEYMSAGLPVIASDFPLWRAIVEKTGSGLLVDPLDPVTIAVAMRWILCHPQEAQAMGFRGRQAVVQEYHWEKELPKLLELYFTLVEYPKHHAQAA